MYPLSGKTKLSVNCRYAWHGCSFPVPLSDEGLQTLAGLHANVLQTRRFSGQSQLAQGRDTPGPGASLRSLGAGAGASHHSQQLVGDPHTVSVASELCTVLGKQTLGPVKNQNVYMTPEDDTQDESALSG